MEGWMGGCVTYSDSGLAFGAVVLLVSNNGPYWVSHPSANATLLHMI